MKRRHALPSLVGSFGRVDFPGRALSTRCAAFGQTLCFAHTPVFTSSTISPGGERSG